MRLRSYFTAAAGIGVIVLSLTVTPARIAVAQMKTLTTEIVNTLVNPVIVKDVDHAQQPWHQSATVFLQGASGNVQTVFVVPAGKRLVIESVSARVAVAPTDSVSVLNFITSVQGFGAFQEIQVSRQGSDLNGNPIYVGTHAVRAYADPNTDVQVQFGRSNITNSASAVITLVGHLVNDL